MPWYKPNLPEYMKKKCYIYLIQRYVGQYLEEKLTAEQLTVDLYKGTGVLTNLRLDVQALNELAEKQNWPFQFVDGFIKKLFVAVPWSSLLKESSTIEITSLRITMQPKQRNESATSMFESMWSSMTSSMHLAEECVKQGLANSPNSNQTYEGLEVFAQTIDSILSRIKVKLRNSVFQFEHLPRGSPIGVGVAVHVESILYADESSNDPTKEEATDLSKQEEKKAYFEQSYTARSARLQGITISTVEFSTNARTTSTMSDSLSSIIESSKTTETEGIEESKPETHKNQYASNDERSIIKFGQFGGKIELVVRLKRTEDLEGPKVSIEMDAAPLLLFLSPRQVHLLFELAAGWTNPDIDDHSDVLNTKYVGKPMSSTDYERIEKDLQQQLANPIPNFQLGFAGGHGWATGALDGSDIDENFTPLGKHSGGLYETAMSGVSTMESSFSSSMASSYTDVTSRTRKKMNKIDMDPTAEISRFEIHLAAVALVLLNEDILTESSTANGRLAPSSVAQMQSTVDKFFKETSDVFLPGDFKISNNAFDEACSLLNHLRLIALPIHIEGDEKTTSSAFSIGGYLEATNLELSEFLYNSETKGIEHVFLISFSDTKPLQFESPATAKPSLKLIFKHLAKTTKNCKTGPKTDLLFELHKCLVELDITLVDRIAALLNPQQICVISKANNPWVMDTGASLTNSRDSKVDIRLTSPEMTINLRFPIPDLRPPNDMTKPPWWHRCVRPDFLALILSGMTFQTSLHTNQTAQDYTLRCRSLNVAYHEDANADPVPIGKAGYEDGPMTSLQDAMTECKLNIQIVSLKRFDLEEPCPSQQEPMATSIIGELLEHQNTNGPFSSKRVIYESDTPHHKYQSDDSKELLVPGDKSEIKDFIKTTTASSRIRLDITIPILSMQLISKCMYEKLYNRINNDLFLWEPGAPKHKPTTPAYDNINYGCFGNIDLDTQDVYTICKSRVQYDSDSATDEENEEGTAIFYSTYGSKMKVSHDQIVSESKKESYLTLNFQIGQGLLYTCTPVRDAATNNVIPNQQGEFLINVENANIFMVSGYMGDADLSYTCVEFYKAHMHHCEMISTPSHGPPLKDIGATPGKHLHPTIYPSESGMLANSKERGGNREMVTLCVKIQASHETHNVKNVSIAAGFNKITLRHKMCTEPNSWVTQLIDFFNVTDDPILGYTSKQILTELFLHFWDSSIDYRPRYLPLRAIITLGTFSISSHLSAEVNTSTLRFIAEDCGLFLSQKGIKKNNLSYFGPVDLKRDYINVIDLGIFEISLKTSDKKNVDTPHFDLRASNDIIHIRTCADSARALTQLIKYLANYGDLVLPEDVTTSGSAFSSPRHLPEQELVSVEPQEINNLSASQHQQINDLIQDALEDVDDGSSASGSMEQQAGDDSNRFYFPGEVDPSKDPIRPLPQVTSELGQVSLPSHVTDSDEDFCFIDEEPGYDIFPKNGVPEIQWLTEDPVRLVENHFALPSEKSDPLKPPKNFPTPTKKYTLCEMSIVWHMYGGDDFGLPDKEKKKTVNFSDLRLRDSVSFSNSQKERVVIESEKVKKKSWLTRGGPNRDHNVLMELQLNKIRFLNETYPESSSKASRQVLIVAEIEMRDRLKSSNMNKFLYQYISQVRPKQSNANMLVIKTLHVRPDPKLRSQECCLKISALPLRFNIDQDALQFLISFFTDLGTDSKDELQVTNSKHNTPVHQPPVMTVNDDNENRVKEEAKKQVNENLIMLFEQENKTTENTGDEPAHVAHNSTEESPVYFRKVIFSPDVPIRLDYHGKHFDLRTHGPLQGLLMGLAQLNCSELRLKRITHRHGLLGFEKLMMFLIKEWVSDIKKNQIPNLLVGVGPMYSFVQLYQGIRDLFFLPFEQYKKDGRFFRGLHRGANSFTTSTAMAALELTTRLIHLIQITAETAFDMLTPGPSVKINPKTKGRRKRYSQPKDIREGVTNAYKLVKEGIEETADNILQVASHEHEQKGYSGAVGGVIRQIPPTIIKPIIIASEATNNVLGGMRCQLVPDARKEANEKWRSEDAYDSYE